MHIQAHDSILIASSHFFGFLSLDVVVCWTEGAAGLPTNTSNADIRGCRAPKAAAPPRGFIPSGLTQPSIGDLSPLQRSSPCRYCASVLVLSVCQSHFRSQSNAPASPPVQL